MPKTATKTTSPSPDHRSYGEVYGAQNPWVQWLAKHAPDTLVQRISRGDKRPPYCPGCGNLMHLARDRFVCVRVHRVGFCDISTPTTYRGAYVYNEDGVKVEPDFLRGRKIDLVLERGKYRARTMIR